MVRNNPVGLWDDSGQAPVNDNKPKENSSGSDSESPALYPIILYDPMEVQPSGRTGLEEAKLIAAERSIPKKNILPIPIADENYKDVLHNNHIIVIAHGNESTNFQTITLRRVGDTKKSADPKNRIKPKFLKLRTNADHFGELLKKSNVLTNKENNYKIELLICKSASSYNSFADNLYEKLKEDFPTVKIKASIGYVQIASEGEISVRHFELSDQSSFYSAPLRGIGSLALTVPRPYRSSLIILSVETIYYYMTG